MFTLFRLPQTLNHFKDNRLPELRCIALLVAMRRAGLPAEACWLVWQIAMHGGREGIPLNKKELALLVGKAEKRAFSLAHSALEAGVLERSPESRNGKRGFRWRVASRFLLPAANEAAPATEPPVARA